MRSSFHFPSLKTLLALLIWTALAAWLIFLGVRILGVDPVKHKALRANLDSIRELIPQIDEQVLRSFQDIDENFEPYGTSAVALTSLESELNETVRNLKIAFVEAGFVGDVELEKKLEVLERTLAEKLDAVKAFEIQDKALKSALRLMSHDMNKNWPNEADALLPLLHDLQSHILLVDAGRAPLPTREVPDRILSAVKHLIVVLSPAQKAHVELLLSHARKALEIRAEVDRLMRQILMHEQPVPALAGAYDKRFFQSLTEIDSYRKLLFLSALAVFLLAGWQRLRLGQRERNLKSMQFALRQMEKQRERQRPMLENSAENRGDAAPAMTDTPAALRVPTATGTEFEVDEVLAQIASVFARPIADKGIEFLFNIGPEVPRRLHGDGPGLTGLLIHLLKNALQFTAQGQIEIRCEASAGEGDRILLRFTVRDTGAGMAPEQLSRFASACAPATRPARDGNGAASRLKQLIAAMGGELRVESEPGLGSRFVFTLPCRVRPGDAPLPFEPRRLKILVADDHEASREALANVLKPLLPELVMASSGIEAIYKVSEAKDWKPFDLIFLNWEMPGMNGIETSAFILCEMEVAQRSQVILTSAREIGEAREAGMAIGVAGFLEKPVRRSALYDLLAGLYRPADGRLETVEISEATTSAALSASPIGSPAEAASQPGSLEPVVVNPQRQQCSDQGGEPPATEAAPEDAASLLPKLVELLRAENPAAVGFVEQHKKALAAAFPERMGFIALMKVVNELDFEEALALLTAQSNNSGKQL